jgi:hypothetical protein
LHNQDIVILYGKRYKRESMTTLLDPKPSPLRRFGTALAPPDTPALFKVARADVVMLRLTADIGPDVCTEVLRVLEREELVAHSIAFTREARRLLLDIEIQGLDPDRTQILLRKIRPIDGVRAANLGGYDIEI